MALPQDIAALARLPNQPRRSLLDPHHPLRYAVRTFCTNLFWDRKDRFSPVVQIGEAGAVSYEKRPTDGLRHRPVMGFRRLALTQCAEAWLRLRQRQPCYPELSTNYEKH